MLARGEEELREIVWTSVSVSLVLWGCGVEPSHNTLRSGSVVAAVSPNVPKSTGETTTFLVHTFPAASCSLHPSDTADPTKGLSLFALTTETSAFSQGPTYCGT